MTPAELFGSRAWAARNAAALTLEQTAERAQLHFNHLSQIERGTRRPSVEVIFRPARVLAVEPMTFFAFDREERDEKGAEEDRRVAAAGPSSDCTKPIGFPRT